MSWRELEGRLAAGDPPAVLVPLGAVEAHGPHLPLDTDSIIATHLAGVASERLAAAGVTTTCSPCLPFSVAAWAAGFPGTVSIREDEERSLLTEALDALGRRAVTRVAFVNLHFDPAHMRVVQAVVEERRASGLAGLVFPDFTRRRHAQRIGGEFATGACHGGQFETSMVLAVEPAKVGAAFRTLAPLHVDLAAAIREGKASFRDVGMTQAYCGNPAAASAEEGARLYRELAAIVAEECLAAWSPASAPSP